MPANDETEAAIRLLRDYPELRPDDVRLVAGPISGITYLDSDTLAGITWQVALALIRDHLTGWLDERGWWVQRDSWSRADHPEYRWNHYTDVHMTSLDAYPTRLLALNAAVRAVKESEGK